MSEYKDRLYKNAVYEHAKKVIKAEQWNPAFTHSQLEFAKALINKGSTVFQDGVHSPEELNIKHGNDEKNKLPLWQAWFTDESAKKHNVFCCNAEVEIDINQTQHKRINKRPLLNPTQEFFTKHGLALHQSKLSGSQCVLEKIAEKK